jgi:hypothetical protein
MNLKVIKVKMYTEAQCAHKMWPMALDTLDIENASIPDSPRSPFT